MWCQATSWKIRGLKWSLAELQLKCSFGWNMVVEFCSVSAVRRVWWKAVMHHASYSIMCSYASILSNRKMILLVRSCWVTWNWLASQLLWNSLSLHGGYPVVDKHSHLIMGSSHSPSCFMLGILWRTIALARSLCLWLLSTSPFFFVTLYSCSQLPNGFWAHAFEPRKV